MRSSSDNPVETHVEPIPKRPRDPARTQAYCTRHMSSPHLWRVAFTIRRRDLDAVAKLGLVHMRRSLQISAGSRKQPPRKLKVLKLAGTVNAGQTDNTEATGGAPQRKAPAYLGEILVRLRVDGGHATLADPARSPAHSCQRGSGRSRHGAHRPRRRSRGPHGAAEPSHCYRRHGNDI